VEGDCVQEVKTSAALRLPSFDFRSGGGRLVTGA
jgi:hypothetical protein